MRGIYIEQIIYVNTHIQHLMFIKANEAKQSKKLDAKISLYCEKREVNT
jgi:hypothetical protein